MKNTFQRAERAATKSILAFLSLVLTSFFITPIVVGQERTKDFFATQNYYNSLISNPSLTMVQLNLFANQMPKGGDVHHHYSGSLYAETYLEWVEKKGYCVIRATFKINSARANQKEDDDCLTVPMIKSDNLYYRQLLPRWSNKDFSNHFHLSLPPDVQFFDTFNYFTNIAEAFYRDGLLLLKSRAKNENLQYIETMIADSPVAEDSLNALPFNSKSSVAHGVELRSLFEIEWLRLENDQSFQNKINDFSRAMDRAAEGLDDADFLLRMQTYVKRHGTAFEVFSSMYSGFKVSRQSSKLVGLNIVGPENGSVSMRDYSLHMKMFKFLKEKYPDVPLALHAGELSLGMVPPEGLRSHITEAVEIAGAKRIGHGIDIMHESDASKLLQRMSRDRIAVEICLTSNEFIAGISGASHPVSLYLQYGVPIVIATDDEGVSRSTISNEYLLFISRYKPSYSMLKKTVYNSIEYSFLSEVEKSTQRKLLDERFSKFEKDISLSVKYFVPRTIH